MRSEKDTEEHLADDADSSLSNSLLIGWGFIIASSLAGGLWSSRFLLVQEQDAVTPLSSFWPLALGVLFLVISFRIGMNIISEGKFYSGLALVIMSILIPVFGALWPFAFKVLRIISDQ